MDTQNTFPAGQKVQVVRLTPETIGDGEVVTEVLDLEVASKKVDEFDAAKNDDELYVLRMA